MTTGTFTTDWELLELVVLSRTAQFALYVTVVTAATTDVRHSVDEMLEQRLLDTRGVDEVLAQYLYTALGWREAPLEPPSHV